MCIEQILTFIGSLIAGFSVIIFIPYFAGKIKISFLEEFPTMNTFFDYWIIGILRLVILSILLLSSCLVYLYLYKLYIWCGTVC